MKTLNGEFITYEKMGENIRHMLGIDYTLEVILKDRLGNGIMYFYRENDTTIAVPFTEFNVADETEIEYNQLGKITRKYNKEKQ